jgi:hypothetical protein
MASTNTPSHSNTDQQFQTRATVGQGVVYPLDFLNIIHDCTSLAELKVIGCVYGYDAIIGIESENLTYSDLRDRTGLKSDKSLSEGIKRAVERKKVKSVEVEGTRFYCPSEKSKVHDHDHVSLNYIGVVQRHDLKDHDHEEKSKARQQLYQIFLNEFGFSQTQRTLRIAHDMCLTPKYHPDRVLNQIRYTRYEIKHGENGNPQNLIQNPAGRLIYRIRSNRPMPQGFSLLEALEAEGWTREQLYQAVYNGELDAPDIEGGFGYASWLANEFGEEFDPCGS